MLNTEKFVDQLVAKGYSHLCVVPCSFAKNLINASINYSDKLEYVPCASEAVACSIATGLKISGKKPIVIVQSSGLTNMGSCITSMLMPYEINFPIIVSWRTYKEGGSEIQHQHLATRLPDLVEAYGYQYTILDKNQLDKAIQQIDECENANLICLLEKETFSKVELLRKHQLDLSKYPKRSEYLKILNNKYKDTNTLFLGTTGNTAREMFSFMPDTNNFYMVGNMGGALSVGLGAAKGGKKVIVCGGDAEFVMHMGGLTTAGRYNNQLLDLTYVLFDNESNKSTGGQKTYQNHIDYIGITNNSNIISHISVIDSLSEFSQVVKTNRDGLGIRFIYVKCSYDDDFKRPSANCIKQSASVL